MSEPFDPEAVRARFEHDPELLAEMVHLFDESSRQWLVEIRTALAGGDLHQAMRIAHTLKGSMSNFLARDAVAAAAKLEAHCRAGDAAAVAAAFAAVEGETIRLREALCILTTPAP